MEINWKTSKSQNFSLFISKIIKSHLTIFSIKKLGKNCMAIKKKKDFLLQNIVYKICIAYIV